MPSRRPTFSPTVTDDHPDNHITRRRRLPMSSRRMGYGKGKGTAIKPDIGHQQKVKHLGQEKFGSSNIWSVYDVKDSAGKELCAAGQESEVVPYYTHGCCMGTQPTSGTDSTSDAKSSNSCKSCCGMIDDNLWTRAYTYGPVVFYLPQMIVNRVVINWWQTMKNGSNKLVIEVGSGKNNWKEIGDGPSIQNGRENKTMVDFDAYGATWEISYSENNWWEHKYYFTDDTFVVDKIRIRPAPEDFYWNIYDIHVNGFIMHECQDTEKKDKSAMTSRRRGHLTTEEMTAAADAKSAPAKPAPANPPFGQGTDDDQSYHGTHPAPFTSY